MARHQVQGDGVPDLYDKIGLDYTNLRRDEPRIAARIRAALGDASSVLNVGAGAGSYEPDDLDVTAVEPSLEMVRQRPETRPAAVVRATAEALPFADASFDAAMAVLTVHHWRDKPRGLAEMRRVARGPVVILTFDPGFRDFWLYNYFPDLATLDEAQMPPLTAYEAALGPVEISPVPIPHECADGFLAAYWRRPAAYLDPRVRAAMSSCWKIGDISEGLDRLRDDLASGTWTHAHGALLEEDARDCGYRLIVTI
jgi:SAM-dependent methyltransferase